MSERETWATRLGFVLAAVGSAVGLGNLWQFPFKTATNGGAAFVVCYLVAVVVIGFPAMLGEFVLGRRTNVNAVDAFAALGHRQWRAVGGLAVLTGFWILSYYNVVGGWVLRYILGSARGAYVADPGGYFAAVSSGPEAVLAQALFLAIVVGVVSLGIEDGIEKATKVMVPSIVVLMLGLAVWVTTLPGATARYDFFLSPDVGAIAANAGTILPFAVGQAFFTLSLGMAIMVTYSSYVGSDDNLVVDGGAVVVTNTLVGVLAGLVVFPILLTIGAEITTETGGAGALFVGLAGAFADVPFGRLVGVVFFGVVLLAALSSAISIFEVLVAYLVDEHGLDRSRSTAAVGGLFLLTGTAVALSPQLFALLADTVANLALTVTLLGFLLFGGWVLGRAMIAEYERGGGRLARLTSRPWYYAVAVVVPLFLTFTLATGVGALVGGTAVVARYRATPAR